MEQLELSCMVGRNAKCYSTLEKSAVVSYLFKHIITIHRAKFLLGDYPNEMKTYVHTTAYV